MMRRGGYGVKMMHHVSMHWRGCALYSQLLQSLAGLEGGIMQAQPSLKSRRQVARALTALSHRRHQGVANEGTIVNAEESRRRGEEELVWDAVEAAVGGDAHVKHAGYEMATMNPRFNDVLHYALTQGSNLSAFALDSFVAHCFVRFNSGPLSSEERLGIQRLVESLPGRFWRLLTGEELLDVLKVLSLVPVKNLSPTLFFWWGVQMRATLDSFTHGQLSELMGLTVALGISKGLGPRFYVLWNARWRRTLVGIPAVGAHVEHIARFKQESYGLMLNYGAKNAAQFDARDVESFFSRFRSRLFAVSPEELITFASICEVIRGKLQHLDAPALAVLPGAFAAFNVAPSEAFVREWCSASGSMMSSFENAALFSIARVSIEGKVVSHSGPWIDFFLRWAEEVLGVRLRTLSTAQLCDVLRIVRHLKIDIGDALYIAWARECSHRLKQDQYSATELALSIHWVGMLKLDPSVLGYEYFKLWTERASSYMISDSFNTTSLVNIICAAARSQFLLKTDSTFVSAWMKAIIPRIGELLFVDVANCLFAVGQLRVRAGFFTFPVPVVATSRSPRQMEGVRSHGADFAPSVASPLDSEKEDEAQILFEEFLVKMEERCQRLLATLPSIPPSGLVLVLSGLEMINAFHLISPNLLSTWLSKFQQYLPQLNALEISQSILSLGRIQLPGDMLSSSLFPSLEALLVKFLPHMEPEQLDDVFEGFELLNWPVDLEVSAQCAAHVSEKMLSVDPKTLSGALRLVRRLKLDTGTVPESFFLDFAQACKQNLLLFPPMDVPWIIASLSHLKIDPAIMGQEFFTNWATLCDGLWPSFSPLHYASIMYDLGYMKLPLDWLAPQFFQHWANHARLLCFLFSPIDVSNTLYGMRLLGLGQSVLGDEFSDSFQGALRRVVGELEPLHLARVVAALPSVSIAWDSGLLQLVTRACVDRAPACSPIKLCHMILGLALLDSESPLVGRAHLELCNMAVGRFTESGWAGLDAAWVRNTWYALTWFQVESPIPPLQTLLPTVATVAAPSERAQEVPTSATTENQDYVRQHYIEELQLHVDIYIPGSRTVVFLDSDQRYDPRSGKLEPFEAFIGELLKRQGYGVMRIDVRGHPA